jgi:hypothetical protein
MTTQYRGQGPGYNNRNDFEPEVEVVEDTDEAADRAYSEARDYGEV